MSKELIVIRFLQIVISASTLIFIYSIMQAKKGNISLHKKINTAVITLVFVGVAGLVVTVMLGWDYQSLTTPVRMRIHRSFSCPLALALPVAAYFGWKGKRKQHLRAVSAVVFFWLGTVITGVWFF